MGVSTRGCVPLVKLSDLTDSERLVRNLIAHQFISNLLNQVLHLTITTTLRLGCFQFTILNEIENVTIRFDTLNFNAVAVHGVLS